MSCLCQAIVRYVMSRTKGFRLYALHKMDCNPPESVDKLSNHFIFSHQLTH